MRSLVFGAKRGRGLSGLPTQLCGQQAFSLVEFLVVISIFAILLSLLMPSLRRGLFDAKNLQCVNNLKVQGVAYSLFCDDHNDLYPGVGQDGKVRNSIYNYWKGNMKKTLFPYFENGEVMAGLELKYLAENVAEYQCPLGRRDQAHGKESMRSNKTYYGAFFNAASVVNSRSTYQNISKDHPSLMARAGDTWTFDRVVKGTHFSNKKWRHAVKGLKFNILAMDCAELKNDKFVANHFREAPDFVPYSNWQPGPNTGHQSAFGTLVLNLVFTDGSAQTKSATLQDLYKSGKEGWNQRDGNNGGGYWIIPRDLSL